MYNWKIKFIANQAKHYLKTSEKIHSSFKINNNLLLKWPTMIILCYFLSFKIVDLLLHCSNLAKGGAKLFMHNKINRMFKKSYTVKY